MVAVNQLVEKYQNCIRHLRESRAALETLRAVPGADRGSWIMKVGLSSIPGAEGM